MNTKISQEYEGEQIDIRALLTNYLRHWYWFVISVLTCLFLAFLYLNYATPQYEVSSTLLIKDDKKGGNVSDMAAFADLGFGQSGQNIANETEVLKSKGLMQRVLTSLSLQVSYFEETAMRSTELYADSVPLRVTVHTLDTLAYKTNLEIRAKGGSRFELLEENEIVGTYSFGTEIQRPYYRFTVTAIRPMEKGTLIRIVFNDLRKLANYYNNEISIEPVNKDASVLKITLVEPVRQRGVDIINKLVELYNSEAIEDKNQIAANTVEFIDDRLKLLVSELSDVEANVERYKREHEITGVSTEIEQYLTQAGEYNRQVTGYETQLRVLASIEEYLQNENSGEQLVPSALGIQDITLQNLIAQFNELQLERQRLLRTTQESNPLVQTVDEQLVNLRRNIQENLRNIKSGLEITRDNLLANTGQFQNRIQRVPTVERDLLEIQREQSIKERLYGYLLQKREESAISMASNTTNSRIIDSAMAGDTPVKPKKILVLLFALIIGIVAPVGALYAKDLLNDKIQTLKDVTNIVDVPILGELSHSDGRDVLVVNKSVRTEIAELFRLIRTNLQFAANGGANQVIMVTSSMSGEGKTFFAINLAASLAITGKKIVVLEFDIRRPRVLKDIELLVKNPGITNYLIDERLHIEDLVFETGLVEGLSVIGAGPIPPNPAELLMSPRIGLLFSELRKQYDHILVDTSPIGQVADAFTLAKYVDMAAYMVRYNYTFKQNAYVIKDIYENKKIHNVMLVMNDAKPENGTRYGYGYGYGYGEEFDEKRSFWKRVKQRIDPVSRGRWKYKKSR
ncbi:GumC family protein [Parapedobacter lycopersici]|uniref:GumC family protein n=1 Tax=Parapedobacter lycopersici TaxID=1864939 RepID=UPI00214DEA20|nr:tyrosine-protein kinase [Parapedobacter lycopersici]